MGNESKSSRGGNTMTTLTKERNNAAISGKVPQSTGHHHGPLLRSQFTDKHQVEERKHTTLDTEYTLM